MRRVLHIGGVGALFVLGLGLGGCDRELEPELCPDVAEGGIVVAEIRGKQSVKRTPEPVNQTIPDPYGEWIELYNASGAAQDLYGLQLRFLTLDGSSEGTVIVRRSLSVAAGDRAVLGYYPDDDALPAHVDYGWFPDFKNSSGGAASLYPTGVIDVYACGVRVDRVRPDGLPTDATWAFPVEPPDAAANDDVLTWCDDGTGATDTEYAPGTPGESNRPCP